MTMKDELAQIMRRQWVSPLMALQLVGCLSLSQRCGEMRREGLKVQDRWVDLPSGKRVKEYRIGGKS
jgi:hypothetical protein